MPTLVADRPKLIEQVPEVSGGLCTAKIVDQLPKSLCGALKAQVMTDSIQMGFIRHCCHKKISFESRNGMGSLISRNSVISVIFSQSILMHRVTDDASSDLIHPYLSLGRNTGLRALPFKRKKARQLRINAADGPAGWIRALLRTASGLKFQIRRASDSPG